MHNQKQVTISTNTIIKGVFVVLAVWFLYLIRDVLALFFLSVIFTATLDPLIDWMQKKKIVRPVGVFIVYVIFFLLLSLSVTFLFPPLVSQFKDFSDKLPQYSEKLSITFSGIETYAKSYGINFNVHEIVKESLGGFSQSSSQIFSTTVSVFTAIISLIVVLSLTFYMSVKEDGMKKFIVSITPRGRREYAVSLFERIHSRVGKWMFGQILLMFVIFVLDFAALSIFNIPYALILAILAGILEIVPYLGPIISASLAALVGFLISPVTGILVLLILTLIQQLESHVIVPQIMRKAVGLNPVVVILALLVGAKLAGTMGAILSVPIATAVSVFVGDIVNEKR